MNYKFEKIEYLFRRNLFKETNIAFDCLDKLKVNRVAKFNLLWTKALSRSEFYRNYKKKNSLPSQIEKVSDLQDFPVISKDDLRTNKEIIFKDYSNLPLISTGGSSGEPFLFPYSKKDYITDLANRFAARKKWGLSERPRTLKLWGHSNVFGAKFLDKLKYQQRRKITDFISNQRTINAYISDKDNLDKIHKKLIRFSPKLIVGYTSTLKNLALYLNKFDIDRTNLFSPELIVVTSENADKRDIEMISKTFKCSVAIEYGLAETGVVAYSFNNKNELHIFKKSFVASSLKNQLIITCLDRLNSFPLIRYQTGDVIKESKGDLSKIKSINGRVKETIFFKSILGKQIRFSVIGITHILKSQNQILAVQCHCDKKNFLTKINISVNNDHKLSLQEIRQFFSIELQKELNQKIDFNIFEINFKDFDKLLKNKKGTLATLIVDNN